jgi:hypothetical protein
MQNKARALRNIGSSLLSLKKYTICSVSVWISFVLVVLVSYYFFGGVSAHFFSCLLSHAFGLVCQVCLAFLCFFLLLSSSLDVWVYFIDHRTYYFKLTLLQFPRWTLSLITTLKNLHPLLLPGSRSLSQRARRELHLVSRNFDVGIFIRLCAGATLHRFWESQRHWYDF